MDIVLLVIMCLLFCISCAFILALLLDRFFTSELETQVVPIYNLTEHGSEVSFALRDLEFLNGQIRIREMTVVTSSKTSDALNLQNRSRALIKFSKGFLGISGTVIQAA